MEVVIGIDPHKASHHAFAVDEREVELAQLSVRATRTQTQRLLVWAEPFEQRVWAVEGADDLGYLLAQQLIAAGERVVNVPATLAARTRLLGTTKSNKTDPNDARSVALTAPRHDDLREVQAVGHSEVLTGPEARANINALARKYLDADYPDELIQSERVILKIAPDSQIVFARGMHHIRR